MKKIALSLSALLFVGLTACNNSASSKINNDESTAENSEMNEASGTNAAANNAANSGNNMSADAMNSEGSPAFSFEEEKHDFGQIQEGTKAKHDFTFTNSGDAPLIISNAKGSCGCTVPQWPREPIAPGESANIHVVFDSSGKPGKQTKQVTLNANTTPNTKVLTISAQVMPKADKQGDAQTAPKS